MVCLDRLYAAFVYLMFAGVMMALFAACYCNTHRIFPRFGAGLIKRQCEHTRRSVNVQRDSTRSRCLSYCRSIGGRVKVHRRTTMSTSSRPYYQQSICAVPVASRRVSQVHSHCSAHLRASAFIRSNRWMLLGAPTALQMASPADHPQTTSSPVV